jgi:signal transduction histidine kinase/CheY-like chemotaxis protein
LIRANHNGHSAQSLSQEDPPNVATLLAPRTDWDQLAPGEHFAQFYDSETFLLNSLSSFVRSGFNADEAVMVVATTEHDAALRSLLRTQGIDIDGAETRGRYFSLNAAEVLSSFMHDGTPDPLRFTEVVGKIVSQTITNTGRVRIFGEMVALLWSAGKYDAAIRLEAMWNELQKTHPFRLYCAYPMKGFGGEAMAAPLREVCDEHSGVIPTESYTALTDHDQRLRAIIELQQQSKSLQAQIEERREVEEKLRDSLVREQMARAEAESASRMKDEFLATVSHELRTPLNAIMGWSHMLRSGRLDQATMNRALETIDRNAKAQAQLVEDILDVSRMITGKLRLSVTPVDMATVVSAALDSVQLAAESKGIQLELTLNPAARHTFGDPGRLQQVVWNLLSNAIKFTPAGGRVAVRLEHTETTVQLQVRDTGEGIKPDFLPFVFDRFRQADATSTRQIGGLGLGLAIVRHMTELHGGSVQAESDGVGCGATFTITLPLALAGERAKFKRSTTGTLRPIAAALPAATSARGLENVQVLLVDDDEDTLDILSAMLTESNASVQTASSAGEALALLQWYKPDVVVSDLAMPDEDGYALIGKVRAIDVDRGSKTPAVALTAYVRVADRARALAAGFDVFVPKPVEPNELINTIVSLTASR